MVAYSFKSRFAGPILNGHKGGTIRADRRRHARPGEELQLYVGMRTKHCRLIARKTCVAIEPIRLDFIAERFAIGHRRSLCESELDVFAKFDGFADFVDMAEFWKQTHGDPWFCGWHIRWLPLPEGLTDE